MKSIIGEYLSIVRNRKEDVVSAQIRSGHTRITHSYLLLGEDQSKCVGYDAPFTIRLFLMACADFSQVRN